MRGGLPHKRDLGWGQGVGLVDEVTEGAFQAQGFDGEGAGGGDGAGVFFPEPVLAGGGLVPIVRTDTGLILPTMIVGNELLILGGVALAVGGWFLAHRYGRMRGFVDANQNGVDDRVEGAGGG